MDLKKFYNFAGHALMTDFYEFTMGQGYFDHERHNEVATFELYYRMNPFDGGYVVACGMHDVVKYLNNFRFSEDDIDYLLSKNLFSEDYLAYLRNLRFSGTVEGVKEGTIVFPFEPIIQVTGELGQVQLIETVLLNIVNYESLIATKSARIATATKKEDKVLEFGLRRAQGLGGMIGTRAAIIGGCSATSNTLAGKLYRIPVAGTQAHSWIQSFDSEIEAFRSYADTFPRDTVLLVDTYDTLADGIPNAIQVAKEMEDNGYKLRGIRIDSGDLAWLAIEAAQMLDDAGLDYVSIVLSSDLNEYIVESITYQILHSSKVKDDPEFGERLLERLLWGIGTHLITGSGDEKAALGGVYKLVEIRDRPVIKISENRIKTTNPGRKKLWRLKSDEQRWIADLMTLYSESTPQKGDKIYHHSDFSKYLELGEFQVEELHVNLLEYYGQSSLDDTMWKESRERVKRQLEYLDSSHKRFLNPHIYKVSLSEKLRQLKASLLTKHGI